VTAARTTGGAQISDLLDMIPEAIVGVDRDGEVVLVNAEASELLGYQRDELLHHPIELLVSTSFGAALNRSRTAAVDDPACSANTAAVQVDVHRKDGGAFLAEIRLTTRRITGSVIVILGIRKVAQRQRPTDLFQGVVEAAGDAAVAVDGRGLIARVNPEAEALFGYTSVELVDRPIGVLVPVPGLDLPDPQTTQRKRSAARMDGNATPLEGRRKDGSDFPVEISLSAIDTNQGLLISAAIRDASDRAETRREEVRADVQRERDVLESRLHQTHRLESLGHLAGGVAHDFNNLLAAILNYSGFVSDEVAAELASRPVEERARLTAVLSDVAQIGAAAERAAGLTHQLLAFARREVRHPEVLDINAIVVDVESLLRRTLGEQVAFVTQAASDLKAVRADRGQMEQILLNLAVNARDAMPNGGTLCVVTENFTVDEEYAAHHPLVDAGSYVRLRVTDTGHGMDRETLDRAFEPFFSTKPKDKGTGLGLATVYGIVSQSAGMVELHSEVGTGTTVTILLPAVAAPITTHDVARPISVHRAGETVLVVEDEELVLDVARRILTQHGYRVLVARSGAEAVALIDGRSEKIDLLLTDVVMPGATGKEVAEAVSARRPGIRVLYMSGYPESVIASQGVVDQGIRLLSKPFKALDLLQHVRAVLDAPISRSDRGGGS
jgi:PAS domain S-box-containing protein